MNKKQAITSLEKLEENLDGLKAFCPTGPGGGVDNSCGRGGSGDDSSGAVDQEAFENAIRDNMSPHALAATISVLQAASSYHPANEEAVKAFRQITWLRNTLTEMLGVDEFNRLIDELGL